MKNISKQILALAIAAPFIASGAAYAEDSYYVKGEVGLAMPQKMGEAKLKKSAIFGIEGGYKMNENFRFGLGLGMLNNVKPKDMPTGVPSPKISSLFAEVNAYYDIGEFNGFTPYLTAGVGVARNKVKSNVSSNSGGGSNNSPMPDHFTPYTIQSGGSMLGVPTVNATTTTRTNPERISSGGSGSGSGSTTTTTSESTKKTGLAWNVGLGTMYSINPDFAVDLTYRYRDLGKAAKDSPRLKSHNVTVGVVYKF